MTTCSQILESRLDNVVYRAGLARTRRQARQFVVHGHFLVNGHKVNIPSYRVSSHDIIDLAAEGARSRRRTSSTVRPTASATCRPGCRCSPSAAAILVHQLPTRAQIAIDVQEQLIVELYSK